MGLQSLVDLLTFPAPTSSYSLTSHLEELFFINDDGSIGDYSKSWNISGGKGSALSGSANGSTSYCEIVSNTGPAAQTVPNLCPIPVMYIPSPVLLSSGPLIGMGVDSLGTGGDSLGAGYVLVHTHSNGCDMGDMVSAMRGLCAHILCNAFVIEYPGYGLYEGKPCRPTIERTGEIVHKFLIETLKIAPERIIWYGRSIGTGCACHLAQLTQAKFGPDKVGGLILQCGFANFKAVARHLFGPLAKIIRQSWKNDKVVATLTNTPVLILHGRADTMIPHRQAMKVWDKVNLKSLSELYLCSCTHNDYNFPRCTLQPMIAWIHKIKYRLYQSLGHQTKTETNQTKTETNFPPIIIPYSLRPKLKHIGLLRNRIPCHTLRRLQVKELEEKVGRTSFARRSYGKTSYSSLALVGNSNNEEEKETGHGEGQKRESVQGEGQDASTGGGGATGSTTVGLSDGKISGANVGNNDNNDNNDNGNNLSPVAKKYATPGSKDSEFKPPSRQGKHRSKFTACTGCGKGDDQMSLICDICLDGDCPFILFQQTGNLLCHPKADDLDVCILLSVRELMHFLTRRCVSFLLNLVKTLETLGPEINSGERHHFEQHGGAQNFVKKSMLDIRISELIEVCESEFWFKCPFPVLYEEIIILKGGQKSPISVLSFGPFKFAENTQNGIISDKIYNYEAGCHDYDGDKEYENKVNLKRYSDFIQEVFEDRLDIEDVLRVPIWGFSPSHAQFRYLTEWCLVTSKRLANQLPMTARECFEKIRKSNKFKRNFEKDDSELAEKGNAVPSAGEGRGLAAKHGGDSDAEASDSPIIGKKAMGRVEKEKKKQPPSALDLGAAFSSHFIQILKNKIPRRICDIFMHGKKAVDRYYVTRASVAVSEGAMLFRHSTMDMMDAFLDDPLVMSQVLSDPALSRNMHNSIGFSGSFQGRKTDVGQISGIDLGPSSAPPSNVSPKHLLQINTQSNTSLISPKQFLQTNTQESKMTTSAENGNTSKSPRSHGEGLKNQASPSNTNNTADTKSQIEEWKENRACQRQEIVKRATGSSPATIPTSPISLAQPGGGDDGSPNQVSSATGSANISSTSSPVLGFQRRDIPASSIAEKGFVGFGQSPPAVEDMVDISRGNEDLSYVVKDNVMRDPGVEGFVNPMDVDVPGILRTVSQVSEHSYLQQGNSSASLRSTSGSFVNPSLRLANPTVSNVSNAGSPKLSTANNYHISETGTTSPKLIGKTTSNNNDLGSNNEIGSQTLEKTNSGGSKDDTEEVSEMDEFAIRNSATMNSRLRINPSLRFRNQDSVLDMTLQDNFSPLRHAFMEYRGSNSRIREALFEVTDTVSEVLQSFLNGENLKKIPPVDELIETIELACEQQIFCGDFFAAILLKHYSTYCANKPLSETLHDPRCTALRKYIHFNFCNLFKPETQAPRKTLMLRGWQS